MWTRLRDPGHLVDNCGGQFGLAGLGVDCRVKDGMSNDINGEQGGGFLQPEDIPSLCMSLENPAEHPAVFDDVRDERVQMARHESRIEQSSKFGPGVTVT